MTEIIHESALVVGVAAAIAIGAAIAAVIALLPAEMRDARRQVRTRGSSASYATVHRIVDVVVGGVAVALLSTVVLILAVGVVDHGSVSAWCPCLVLAASTAAAVAKVFPTNAGVFRSGSMS